MKTVPAVYTHLMNTIYLSIPRYTGSGGTVFRKHTITKGCVFFKDNAEIDVQDVFYRQFC